MAEEVRDAGRYVPMSIVWSYVGNGVMAIIFLITYLFAIDDVDDALADPSGFPFIHVFSTAVNTAGVNGLTSMVLIIVVFANISFNASTARQTFAFARDNGLPFSKWIGHVHPKLQIPANAIAFTCIFTCLISLINIGSNVAFNAIISLQVVAIMMTYSVSVGCVLYRRIAHPELIPTARWSLGRFGIPVNAIGLAYSLFTFFWSFWPNTVPVTLQTMNWAVVLFMGVLILSLLYYVAYARKLYVGPVSIVRPEKIIY
jgi:amino acid transporter